MLCCPRYAAPYTLAAGSCCPVPPGDSKLSSFARRLLPSSGCRASALGCHYHGGHHSSPPSPRPQLASSQSVGRVAPLDKLSTFRAKHPHGWPLLMTSRPSRPLEGFIKAPLSIIRHFLTYQASLATSQTSPSQTSPALSKPQKIPALRTTVERILTSSDVLFGRASSRDRLMPRTCGGFPDTATEVILSKRWQVSDSKSLDSAETPP